MNDIINIIPTKEIQFKTKSLLEDILSRLELSQRDRLDLQKYIEFGGGENLDNIKETLEFIRDNINTFIKNKHNFEILVEYVDKIYDLFKEAPKEFDTLKEIADWIKNNQLYKIVDELPEKGEDNKIYLINSNNPLDNNKYQEYIYINNTWEEIGGSIPLNLLDFSNNLITFAPTKQSIITSDDFKTIVENNELINKKGLSLPCLYKKNKSDKFGFGILAFSSNDIYQRIDIIVNNGLDKNTFSDDKSLYSPTIQLANHAYLYDTRYNILTPLGVYIFKEFVLEDYSVTEKKLAKNIIENIIEKVSQDIPYSPFEKGSALDSAVLKGGNNKSTGISSTTIGYQNHSEGESSFTTGSYNSAFGNNAVATGRETKAQGYKSFTSGTRTVANGENSFATGHESLANGENSFATGRITQALGKGSHSEGNGNGIRGKAVGDYSHSEGNCCCAIAIYSHAEGNWTDTTNDGEHAEGEYNKSNKGQTNTEGTIHSVGIGTSNTNRKNAHEIMKNGKHYIYGIGGYDGTNPDNSNDLATVITNISGGMTNVTYNELVELRNSFQLKPGMFYRITDYVTTTTQENTQSAGHPFDIVVLALSENKLSEQAYAAIHEGDTYFTENGANLSAWKIWYCLDNDSTRFAWADTNKEYIIELPVSDNMRQQINNFFNGTIEIPDTLICKWWDNDRNGPDGYGLDFYQITNMQVGSDDVILIAYPCGSIPQSGVAFPEFITTSYEESFPGNVLYFNGQPTECVIDTIPTVTNNIGKGVIYRLIDEWNNDCPYDFKNILFEKRTYEDGELEKTKYDGDVLLYCYTFSWLDENGLVLDLSIYGNNGYVYNDESASGNVRDNKISPYSNIRDIDNEHVQIMNVLNDIVFLSTYYYEDRLMYGCYGNYFDNNCKDISINNNCQNNKFGCNCRDIWLASDCSNNTFGQECYDILLGLGCNANTFGSYTKIQILNSDGELINNIVGCSFGNFVKLNIEVDVFESYPFRGVIVMPNVSGSINIQLSKTNSFIAADSDGKPFLIIANQFKN